MRRAVVAVAVAVALATVTVACTRRVAGGFSADAGRTAAAGTPTAREGRLAADLVARIDAERVARGLRPLAVDRSLAADAFRWSRTMASTGFRHSDLHPLLDRFVGAAENIGTGALGTTTGEMHLALMRSDGHRHDILAPNLDHVGVAVFCAADGTMWATERFGSTRSGDFGAVPPSAPIARADAGSLTC